MTLLDAQAVVAGIALSEVNDAVGTLVPETIRVLDVTRKHAVAAAEVRARRYHRTRSPLSLADCVALALAGDVGTIASADGPCFVLRRPKDSRLSCCVTPEDVGHASKNLESRGCGGWDSLGESWPPQPVG